MIFLQILAGIAAGSAIFFVFMFIIRTILEIRSELRNVISTLHSELNRNQTFMNSSLKSYQTILLDHINSKLTGLTCTAEQAKPVISETKIKQRASAKKAWERRRAKKGDVIITSQGSFPVSDEPPLTNI